MKNVSIDKTVSEVLKLKNESAKLSELVTSFESRVYEKLEELEESERSTKSNIRQIQSSMNAAENIGESEDGSNVTNWWKEVREAQSQLAVTKDSKYRLESLLTNLRELSSNTWLKYQSKKNALEAVVRAQKTVNT